MRLKGAKIIKKRTKFLRKFIHIQKFDLLNKFKYGFQAPRFAERIWVNPCQCKSFTSPAIVLDLCKVSTQRKASGLVVNGNWPFNKTKPVTEMKKLKYCYEHWVEGVPWEKTGIYDYMEKRIKDHAKKGKAPPDGCKNIKEVIQRYENLDHVFNQAKQEGKLKTMKELNPTNFREYMGPCIHIGPDGHPYFAMRGSHRFAIAYILNLPLPAQIGCVHISAIPYLGSYRKSPNTSYN